MNNADIIIIGAGAAGLMAMHELVKTGLKVCLLEAAAVPGGRIATIEQKGFDQPVETGAEFVHGQLPLTLSLLKKAGIAYIPVDGKMMAVQNKKWLHNEAHDEHWEIFMQQLGKLKRDMTITRFLEQYFSVEKYASLRAAVKQYAAGYDLADITKASALAAQREWSNEDETQYRIPGGYRQLIDFLLAECKHTNAAIHFNAIVKEIAYNHLSVTVTTTDNKKYKAAKLLITVSAGVLHSGAVEFVPALPQDYASAIRQIGFGDVIKILLQFTTTFWKKHATGIGFILSDEPIPTWWTQLSIENNLLTGWLGGPHASALSGENDASLLKTALTSLADIFNLPFKSLQKELVHHKITCWRNHPYVKGGYSFNTVDSANAKKILAHPLSGTIFFAGEAMHNGQSQGTVEAALQTGRAAAKKITSFFFPK